MDSLTQRNEEKRYEKIKRKHKMTIAFTVTICTAAAIALFLYIVNSFINKVYTSYEVIASTDRQDSNSVQYQPYNGKLLKFSRDGASGIDPKGDILWNGSYEMQNPAASTSGEYVIISDIGGKESYVYNGKNSGVLLEETLPIIQSKIAGQGVAAVVLEDVNSNEIHIYNPFDSNASLLFTKSTNVKEDGYPVDIDLSEDGRKLVTNYLGVHNGVTQTKITFYNFGEIGKDKDNFIVGGIDMGQELCPDVEFINNDTVCIYGEQSFQIYSMQELPEEVYKEEFSQPIKNAVHNEQYLGFVLEDATLLAYDLQGKKVLEEKLDYEFDKISFTDREILFTSDLACRMMRFNGQIKWDYKFSNHVNAVFPVKERDRFLFIDDVKINYIKLTKE